MKFHPLNIGNYTNKEGKEYHQLFPCLRANQEKQGIILWGKLKAKPSGQGTIFLLPQVVRSDPSRSSGNIPTLSGPRDRVDPDLYQHNLRVLWIIGASSLFVDIYQPAGILLVWKKAPPSFSCVSMYLVITSTSCLKCLYCHMMAAIMLCYLFS